MTIKCCMDCADRHVGCHGTCDRYITEKKAQEELRDKIQAQRDFDNIFIERAQGAVIKRSKVHRLYKGKVVGQK